MLPETTIYYQKVGYYTTCSSDIQLDTNSATIPVVSTLFTLLLASVQGQIGDCCSRSTLDNLQTLKVNVAAPKSRRVAGMPWHHVSNTFRLRDSMDLCESKPGTVVVQWKAELPLHLDKDKLIQNMKFGNAPARAAQLVSTTVFTTAGWHNITVSQVHNMTKSFASCCCPLLEL